jgi:2',3'-cyclic-nucleotide 2'-phosphodiesterase (5'-nucleotidase family)
MTRRSTLVRLLAALAVTVLGAAVFASAALSDDDDRPSNKPHFTLTILHNNDGETKLTAAAAPPSPAAQYGGIARFATLVDKLRAEALKKPAGQKKGPKRGVVLLSSGDQIIPGPEFAASLAKGPPFYDSIGLDMIGYDAMSIGNHEFDLGPEVLADFIEGFDSPLPFLSANLDYSGEPRLQALVRSKSRACGRGGDDDDDDDGDDARMRGGDDDDDDDDDDDRSRNCGGFLAQSIVVREAGEKVGIVGVTTPLLPAISTPRNVVVDPDVAEEVQKEVNRLQKQKVGIIILLSHLQSINNEIALAPMLKGVDVIIAGGGQEFLANPGTPVVPGDVITPARPYPVNVVGGDGVTIPIITTPGDYKYVGKLTVDFDKRGRILAVQNGPFRVSGNPADADISQPDPEIQAAVVNPVAAYIAAQAANILATSEVGLDGRRALVRRKETNLGNLMADSLMWQGQQLAATFGVTPPNVGIQNAGGIRNNTLLPAGPFSELNTFQVAAFPNFVSVVPNIPPLQLKEILENAVSNIAAEDGRFAQVAGLRFTYDAAGTAQVVNNDGVVLTPGTRIRTVTLDNGTPIIVNGAVAAGAPSVSIATNDFSARGGDQYPFRGAPFTNIGVLYQQSLSNYVTSPLGLNGAIRAVDYPAGGEGRITCIDTNGPNPTPPPPIPNDDCPA